MGLQKGAHRSASLRVPNYEHAIVAGIRCHNPVLVVRAQDRCDLVAVTLQQLLLLGDVVVDDTGVGSRVEDLRALVVGQEVNTLIDVFIETVNLG